MAIYSSGPEVLPSLVFTKAELLYVLTRLTHDIDPDDNETGIEMVEVRHYLNLIKDRVAAAVADGTLRSVLEASAGGTGNDASPAAKTAPMPSMEDLRREFPNLTDIEIVEVIETAKKEKREEAGKALKEEALKLPPKPSFIAKPKEKAPAVAASQPAKEKTSDAENSEKFARMLGSF